MLAERIPIHLSNSRPPRPPAAGFERGSEASAPWLATHILIIEDEMMIAWMLETLLLDAGFSDIVMASDAAEAVRLGSEVQPGLIISDINLGAGDDGVAASISVSASGAVPVIFITAHADRAARERISAELPRAQLLRKPIEAQMLLRAVREALATQGSN